MFAFRPVVFNTMSMQQYRELHVTPHVMLSGVADLDIRQEILEYSSINVFVNDVLTFMESNKMAKRLFQNHH